MNDTKYDPSNDQMLIAAHFKEGETEDRVGGITYIRHVGMGIRCFTVTLVKAKAFDDQPTVEVETMIVYVDALHPQSHIIHTERINITNL